MTDKEIIKALEYCIRDDYDYSDCKECPFYGNGCGLALIKVAYDLINRQQKVIEEFTLLGKLYSEIRAEAIKEFAGRLKGQWTAKGFTPPIVIATIAEIDNLVKEMVGADNG